MTTNSNDATRARRPTRIALVGIAILLVLGVTIALNLDGIKSLWGMGADVLRLRSAVQEKFDVQDVSINFKGGTSGKSLEVELANPPFEDLAGEALESKAKEIAKMAYDDFGAERDFERISVVISDKSGTVITISEKQEFHFTPEELSAENEADSDETPAGAAMTE